MGCEGGERREKLEERREKTDGKRENAEGSRENKDKWDRVRQEEGTQQRENMRGESVGRVKGVTGKRHGR